MKGADSQFTQTFAALRSSLKLAVVNPETLDDIALATDSRRRAKVDGFDGYESLNLKSQT
jgi:hypothetical protein